MNKEKNKNNWYFEIFSNGSWTVLGENIYLEDDFNCIPIIIKDYLIG